jgi:hypothetical protein
VAPVDVPSAPVAPLPPAAPTVVPSVGCPPFEPALPDFPDQVVGIAVVVPTVPVVAFEPPASAIGVDAYVASIIVPVKASNFLIKKEGRTEVPGDVAPPPSPPKRYVIEELVWPGAVPVDIKDPGLVMVPLDTPAEFPVTVATPTTPLMTAVVLTNTLKPAVYKNVPNGTVKEL